MRSCFSKGARGTWLFRNPMPKLLLLTLGISFLSKTRSVMRMLLYRFNVVSDVTMCFQCLSEKVANHEDG